MNKVDKFLSVAKTTLENLVKAQHSVGYFSLNFRVVNNEIKEILSGYYYCGITYFPGEGWHSLHFGNGTDSCHCKECLENKEVEITPQRLEKVREEIDFAIKDYSIVFERE